jgi:hypothetical protein
VRIRLGRRVAAALSHAHVLPVTLTVTARYRAGARITTERLKLRR